MSADLAIDGECNVYCKCQYDTNVCNVMRDFEVGEYNGERKS